MLVQRIGANGKTYDLTLDVEPLGMGRNWDESGGVANAYMTLSGRGADKIVVTLDKDDLERFAKEFEK